MKKYFLLVLVTILPCIFTNSIYGQVIDGIDYLLYSSDNTAYVSSGTRYYGDIIIPEKVVYRDKEYSVVGIVNNAFYSENLTSVTIPNTFRSIPSHAFAHCSKLTRVNFPNSISSIGDGAFYKCTSLMEIELPNSVILVGDSAFRHTGYYNKQPDGLIYNRNWLLDYKGTTSSNTSIKIKDGTTNISNGVFRGWYGLTSVTIPNSVTSIGNRAFYGCSGLTSVTIPNSVTSIGNSAFYYLK